MLRSWGGEQVPAEETEEVAGEVGARPRECFVPEVK